MSETSTLLGKIASLRQRLQQAQGLATEAGAAAANLFSDEDAPIDLGASLHKQVDLGLIQQALLDDSIRQLADDQKPTSESLTLPTIFTAHARRLLEQGRSLLGQLRTINESIEKLSADAPALPSDSEPDGLYREVMAMTDTILRLIQAFPNAPSAQLRLCQGLEPMLSMITHRLAILQATVQRRQQDRHQWHVLKSIMTGLMERKPVEIQALTRLAEKISEEANDQLPIRFYPGLGTESIDWTAGHGLNVAQVMARVIRHHPDLRTRPLDGVSAALIHDVGMLEVPTEILHQKEPLSDESRRLIEGHVFTSARLAGRLFPGATLLVDAVEAHHERLDGTGYPGGKRETQISALARLLAVCDVYASFRVSRPQRPARESRTALTDTLLLADQGQLDKQAAEHLLTLSFYPVGSLVEMTDGTTGLVLAAPLARHDLQAPSRPVVKLLTDSQGKTLPIPRYLDLAQSDHGTIVRTLPPHKLQAFMDLSPIEAA